MFATKSVIDVCNVCISNMMPGTNDIVILADESRSTGGFHTDMKRTSTKSFN